MINKQEVIKDIDKYKIITILRGLTKEQVLKTVDAMIKGGIKLVEVTFDQSGKISEETTADSIKAIAETFKGKVRVGAGTVMTEKQVELAYNAGAEFIISPDCYEPVIKKTLSLNMVSIPGVYSPTESANSYRYGADYAKLFPNSELGISYLKAISAPLSHIKFLAVGGVNADNMLEYLNAGAKGIGVATSIVDKKAIALGDYNKITELAKKFTSQIK